jgi:hypothetical protein
LYRDSSAPWSVPKVLQDRVQGRSLFDLSLSHFPADPCQGCGRVLQRFQGARKGTNPFRSGSYLLDGFGHLGHQRGEIRVHGCLSWQGDVLRGVQSRERQPSSGPCARTPPQSPPRSGRPPGGPRRRPPGGRGLAGGTGGSFAYGCGVSLRPRPVPVHGLCQVARPRCGGTGRPGRGKVVMRFSGKGQESCDTSRSPSANTL